MKRLISLLVAATLGGMPGTPAAAPPALLNYQGNLTNAAGTPVNGSVSMTLRLYTSASGGAPLYAETQNVTVASGLFNVQIGAVTSLGLPFDVPYFLGVTIGSDPEMTPRQPLTSSAYSFRAGNADAARSLLSAGGASLVRAEAGATLFVGENAGPVAGTGGGNNTATGSGALGGLTTGFANSAFGANTLLANTQGVHNTALGFLALTANTIGGNNIAVGGGALLSNTGGSGNTAVGYTASVDNISGSSNTALGNNALFGNTTGSRNIGIGFNGGRNLTSGSDNIAIGHTGVAAESATLRIGSAQTRAFMAGVRGVSPPGGSPLPVVIDAAGQLGTGVAGGSSPLPSGGADTQVLIGPGSAPAWSGSPTLSNLTLANNLTLTQSSRVLMEGINSFMHVTGGPSNTFIGADAGNFSQTGSLNTAVGSLALSVNTSGRDNTALGANSLKFNTIGYGNTAIGSYALASNTMGENNTAAGYGALANNTTGAYNVALGRESLGSNTTGGANTAVGGLALSLNTNGSFNVAIGTETLNVNSTGSSNTATGHAALAGNTTGSDNTASGSGALAGNSTGSNNTAFGSLALSGNTIGTANTATGMQALHFNSTGIDNTANGYFALFSSTTGSSNTAVGRNAAYSNTVGDDNTAMGRDALYNSTGSSNTAFGRNAAYGTTIAINNTALGRDALYNTSTGSGNIAVGRDAGFNLTTGSNNIAIGNSGVAADSATIRLGSSQTRTFIAGIRGITTGSATGIPVLIDSNGQLGTASSSASVKDDIADMHDASAVLAKLRPVTFRYKGHEGGPQQYGLIAEEVAAIAPELVARQPDGRIETVYYQHLPPMLLNEWQKQQRTIESQSARIESLERDIALLKELAMKQPR